MEDLLNKIDSIIDWLTDGDGENSVDESDVRDAKIELKELKVELKIYLDNL